MSRTVAGQSRRLALGVRPEGAPSFLVDDEDVKLSCT
jgi:hypothetical protein